jgi:hypothetical protein
MSSAGPSAAPAFLTSDDVARIVGKLAGRRLVEHICYLEDADVVALQSGHVVALIERDFIGELKDVPRDQMKHLTVSAGGTTVALEDCAIHIEAAGLLANYINHLRATRTGGPILDLIEGRMAAG